MNIGNSNQVSELASYFPTKMFLSSFKNVWDICISSLTGELGSEPNRVGLANILVEEPKPEHGCMGVVGANGGASLEEIGPIIVTRKRFRSEIQMLSSFNQRTRDCFLTLCPSLIELIDFARGHFSHPILIPNPDLIFSIIVNLYEPLLNLVDIDTEDPMSHTLLKRDVPEVL